jgi:hypothetical protein
MKRKNLLLSIGAAAVLGVFNPAFAGDDAKVGAGASADVNANTDQKASTSQSSTVESPVSRDSSPQAAAPSDGSTGANASAGASGSVRPEIDKKKGLDRADQAAGEHGQQGRDNAREKQSTNRY